MTTGVKMFNGIYKYSGPLRATAILELMMSVKYWKQAAEHHFCNIYSIQNWILQLISLVKIETLLRIIS